MTNDVIRVENLGKQYRLGEVGTGTLSHDLKRAIYKMRGKDDPFLTVGDENDRAAKGGNKLVWALKDINFNVKQGEVLGIIGKNGAGKSTLLKIISQVTSPTVGNIKIKGRIAALLEVGTGFHQDLTGRENVYLNGSILGMTKAEIKSKFDEIVNFSGIEKYIDTPVKRYSSGMIVRLGFGVAAHLDPEILIVDEVLAVGDAEFQKKCLGKMKNVSSQGRTVLFVSHNLTAMKSLCPRSIYLINGKVALDGSTEEVVNSYIETQATSASNYFENSKQKIVNEFVRLIKIEKTPLDNGQFDITEELEITLVFENISLEEKVHVNFYFNTPDGICIFRVISDRIVLKKGTCQAICKIPSNQLNNDIYSIEILIISNGKSILNYKDALLLEGIEPARDLGWMGKVRGLIRPPYVAQLINI